MTLRATSGSSTWPVPRPRRRSTGRASCADGAAPTVTAGGALPRSLQEPLLNVLLLLFLFLSVNNDEENFVVVFLWVFEKG